MKYLSSLFLLLILVAPVRADGVDFQQLLSGSAYPESLKLSDLSSDWRHVRIGGAAAKGSFSDQLAPLVQAGMMSDAQKGKGKDDSADTMLGLAFLNGLSGGQDQGTVYYTKGQTVAAGGETFLVAYHFEKPPVNLMQLAMESEKSGKEPDFNQLAGGQKLSADSLLTLALVNVRTIGTMSSIRPFDLNQEIAESAQEGGGLMDLIAQEMAKEEAATKPKPAPAPRTPARRKPSSPPRSRP